MAGALGVRPPQGGAQKETEMSLKDDAVIQALLATPPTGVAVVTIAGYSLPDLVMFGTAALIVLQIGFLLHKWVLLIKGKE